MIHKTKAFRLSILALFIAFIIIQNFVPLLGYIPVGPLSLTTIQITVIIAAVIFGPVDGGIVGAVWGILSCIKAFTAPSSPVEPLIFTNPLIAVIPRIVVGIVAGYLFILLNKLKFKKTISMVLSGLAGALTNTILVLGLIYIFYRTPAVAHAYGVSDPKYLGGLLLVVIATNGIPEAILSSIITPIISLPLGHYINRDE